MQGLLEVLGNEADGQAGAPVARQQLQEFLSAASCYMGQVSYVASLAVAEAMWGLAGAQRHDRPRPLCYCMYGCFTLCI